MKEVCVHIQTPHSGLVEGWSVTFAKSLAHSNLRACSSVSSSSQNFSRNQFQRVFVRVNTYAVVIDLKSRKKGDFFFKKL